MKLSEAVPVINAAIDADIPLHLWSAPGVGKSDAVKAVAAARGADLCDIRLNLFDPVDLRGLPAIVDGLTVWLKPQIWAALETGRDAVLFFDEMDRATPAVMSAAMQIVLDRRIGEHVLPERVRILAAGNGKTDRSGTNRMPEALANRFCHLDIEPDVDAWAAWAAGADIAPELIGFMRFRPALLHKCTMTENDARGLGDRAFPSPRAWARIDKVMGRPDAVRHAIAAGLVGTGPAAEFEGFVRTVRDLPSLAAVLADPHGAPVPGVGNPAALYAMASALARKADPSNFGNVLAYVRRMPKEFEILTMVDAVRRAPELASTFTYASDWAPANSKVLA